MVSLRRRIGFGPGGAEERCVVVQADELCAALETVLVAPLDRSFGYWEGMPGAMPIPGREAGLRTDQVALITLVTCVPTDRFEQAPVGRLKPASLARLKRALRVVLDLD